MEQLKMIDQIREIGLNDNKVNAILMYGSFSQGDGDTYSDIEFYIFHENDTEIDKRIWISGVHPVEILFTNDFGTDVAIFDNLVRGEFHFHPVSEIGVISEWQGALDFSVRDQMTLVDKDALLAGVLDKIQIITPEWSTPGNIIQVADSMVNNLIFVRNVIRRGEYARAAHLFFFIEKYLACMIRLHCSTTAHWLDPMKALEKEIPSEWYQRYAACVPELNPQSLKTGFTNALQLTKELFGLLDIPGNYFSILNKLSC